ncbi:MAG: hypothetical protein J0I47_01610 [Sphingomonas sp.]|uniref:hypothetical protein n=1 Tax=Sphingomonas sp. TaxID=28214 RepID=UPI001ACF0305|nr:hypothetical protein [Sphingomonas sp.]MBN8806926.1 hypothetical protein [Sphingomonas sp.]
MPQARLDPSAIHPQAAHFDWIYYKSWLSLWLHAPDDVLHIHAGLLILVVSAWVLRRPPWDWRPYIIVVAIESANELYDVFQTAYVTDEGNWASAWHDFWLTMLWPTVILVAFRWLVRRGERRALVPDASTVEQRLGEDADVRTDIGPA